MRQSSAAQVEKGCPAQNVPSPTGIAPAAARRGEKRAADPALPKPGQVFHLNAAHEVGLLSGTPLGRCVACSGMNTKRGLDLSVIYDISDTTEITRRSEHGSYSGH